MKPYFDYDGDDFYDEILALALQGYTDAEIADGLGDKFDHSLDPVVFSRMKNGYYNGWTKEENERRSARICKVLARGRRKNTAIVRGAYLKAALGGKKTRNKSTVIISDYDDNGQKVGEHEAQRTESEIELAPNLQALSVWLYHHDPEWRKIQRGQDAEAADIPTDVQKGVDIDSWIKKETEVKDSYNETEDAADTEAAADKPAEG